MVTYGVGRDPADLVTPADTTSSPLMPREVTFSTTTLRSDRVYHVTEDDLRVVLGRLPEEVTSRLRSVHFNDLSQGARRLGYAGRGRREVTLCALPPRVSLSRFLGKGQSPKQFGARRGTQWPELAIRRYLLYGAFLPQLGHLLEVDEEAKSDRRKFAADTLAEEFATMWRKHLWSSPFEHDDPAHFGPGEEELAALEDG